VGPLRLVVAPDVPGALDGALVGGNVAVAHALTIPRPGVRQRVVARGYAGAGKPRRFCAERL
jgi:hypothetical protein